MEIKILAWLLISLFIMSCNSGEPSETTEKTTKEEEVKAMPLDATTWEGFWHLFQDAASHKDKETIQALCHFNEMLQETVLESDFDAFFNEEMLARIRETPANSFEIQDNISTEFTEVRTLQLINTEQEYAYILLFGKKEGEFGVIRMAMAG